MPSSTSLARSPMAAQATPKKIEKTTICRISLSTIGRIAESGKTCLTKPSSVMACASMPELTPLTTLWIADAGLEQVHQDQAERQRHQRGADEPQHRLAAHPADRSRVGHVADADDQGREHQRRDDHLDQPQEDHAAERDVGGERLLRGRAGELVVDQPAGGDPQHHREDDVGRHAARLHRRNPLQHHVAVMLQSLLAALQWWRATRDATPGTNCRGINGAVSATSHSPSTEGAPPWARR